MVHGFYKTNIMGTNMMFKLLINFVSVVYKSVSFPLDCWSFIFVRGDLLIQLWKIIEGFNFLINCWQQLRIFC